MFEEVLAIVRTGGSHAYMERAWWGAVARSKERSPQRRGDTENDGRKEGTEQEA